MDYWGSQSDWSSRELGCCSARGVAISDLVNLGSCRGFVLEPQGVDGCELAGFARYFSLREYGTHRTGRFADATIDAVIGFDEAHAVFILGDNAINGTDFDTRLVHDVNAGAGDYVGHRLPLVRSAASLLKVFVPDYNSAHQRANAACRRVMCAGRGELMEL